MTAPTLAGPQLRIGDRVVGAGHPAYIVAELSANHGQRLERALELVRLAAEAGADAVKIQTYRPETMTLDADQPWFHIRGGTPWDGAALWDLYAEALTPWDWTGELQAEATSCGVHFFSSPFDATAVEFLEPFDLPVYKIASFELVDLGLIATVASTGKPLIMSTGMATIAEIADAVTTAVAAGAGGIALLHCNSAYPSPPGDMDLRTIPHLRDAWDVPVGLSDHTLGSAAAVAAVALGASIIEKHLTLSRADAGPDSGFSLEPAEFAQLVAGVREVEAAMGTVRYGPSDAEKASLPFRRSLFAIADVREGERLSKDNVASIRPANGLPPRYLPVVIGRRAARDLVRGTPLSWDVIA